MDVKVAKEKKLRSFKDEMNKVFAELAELEDNNEQLTYEGKFSI